MTFFFIPLAALPPTAKKIHQFSSKFWHLKATWYVNKAVLLLFSEKRENIAL